MLPCTYMKQTFRINRDSPIPYYYQLKRMIQDKLDSGEYKPGDRLPGEHALEETFSVSRTVVRQALAELEVEGALQRRKGRGTFVAPKKVPEYLFQNFTGLSEDVAARGSTLRSVVWRLEVIPPPDDSVARELELQDGDSVIVLERLRFVDEVPWVVVTTYLPYKLCPELLEEDLQSESLYELLEQKYNILIAYGKRSVEASKATPKIARSLDIREDSILLRLRSTAYSEDGRPLEYFVANHRGDRSRFEVNLLRRRRTDSSNDAALAPNIVIEKSTGDGQV